MMCDESLWIVVHGFTVKIRPWVHPQLMFDPEKERMMRTRVAIIAVVIFVCSLGMITFNAAAASTWSPVGTIKAITVGAGNTVIYSTVTFAWGRNYVYVQTTNPNHNRILSAALTAQVSGLNVRFYCDTVTGIAAMIKIDNP